MTEGKKIKGVNGKKKRRVLKKHEKPLIPKPLTPFFLFGQEMKKNSEFSDLKITDLSKVLAEKWKELSEEKKDVH